MNFKLPTDIYLKLQNICDYFPSNITDRVRESINCVRLEYKNGKYFALSTNSQIMSVYYLGHIGLEDAVAHLVIDQKLVNQCMQESPFMSVIELSVFEELTIGNLKTSLGYEFPDNACVFHDYTPLNDWFRWVPDAPATKPNASMKLDEHLLSMLSESSPSTSLVFPTTIDHTQPVIVRDLHDENWCGVLKPGEFTEEEDFVTIPQWWVHE